MTRLRRLKELRGRIIPITFPGANNHAGRRRAFHAWGMPWWLAAVFLLVGLAGVPAAGADDDAVYLVAHPDVSTRSLNRDNSRAMFAMRQRNWPDGASARVYVLPDSHPVHARFTKERLRVFPHQLRLSWDRAVFSGTGQAPREVGSLSEMRERVATTPGAMGYLTKEYLDERVQVIDVR